MFNCTDRARSSGRSKGFVAVTSNRSIVNELHSLLPMLPVNPRGTGMIHEGTQGDGDNPAYRVINRTNTPLIVQICSIGSRGRLSVTLE